MATARAASAKTALAAVRVRRGLSQVEAVDAFLKTARRMRVPMQPTPVALKGTLSRWENGHQVPDEPARRVLRTIYQATDEELGFPTSPHHGHLHDDQEAQLAARLASATRVDASLVAALASEVESLRRQDRSFGALILAERMNGVVKQLTELTRYSITPDMATQLAGLLADAATLAGWQAVDAGATVNAWDHFTTATDAARLSGSPILLAHALGERAYAVLEAGQPAQARQMVAYALTLTPLPSRVTAWLHAASGELAAAAGDRDQALRAFDAAEKLLPATGLNDEDCRFIMLDHTHLARWRGSSLASLADPEAVTYLTSALETLRIEDSTVRATAGLHTDLASAYATARDRDQALMHLREAERLAMQIGSQRLRKRLEQLRGKIPGQ